MGWVGVGLFQGKDFSLLGSADSIDKALSRLAVKGTTRRLTRGLYDFPRYSKWLKSDLGPDMGQVPTRWPGSLAGRFR